ncbi:MAG TPA: hypothetical protein VFS76_15790 [Pyrinomonadaceae bacterium]|nr:hypothetical protein [Pyrinomonadaceae bacterium]
MTLHLTQVSNLYTLQVADRLVSGRTNDPMAKKNVIYAARDAIVTLGYTGLAYDLDYPDRLIPTDEWIASKLLGGPIPRVFDAVRPPAGGTIQNAHWLSIGQSIQHLKKEIEKVFKKLPSTLAKHRFELIIAGWLLPKRRFIRPFAAEIIKAPNERSLRVEFPMRGCRFETRFGLWTNLKLFHGT